MSVMHDVLKVIKSPKYRDKPVAEIRTALHFPLASYADFTRRCLGFLRI